MTFCLYFTPATSPTPLCFSYCDSYENRCHPCSQLCEVTGELGECREQCPLYLHTVMHASMVESDQLRHLTIMVSIRGYRGIWLSKHRKLGTSLYIAPDWRSFVIKQGSTNQGLTSIISDVLKTYYVYLCIFVMFFNEVF